jgi:molecular chaperone GrpE
MPENMSTTSSDEALDAALAEASAAVRANKSKSPADQKVAELESQLREATERALRSQAELENYRKRMQRELADERRYAVVPLVRDLLAVLDNLERAIEATQARSASEGTVSSRSNEVASLLAGVKMVASQLENVLKQHQCTRIETVGAPFDPNFHQALAQEPSDEHPAGTITREAQLGYRLHDRVIRPAQVFVSTGPAKQNGESVPA